MDSILRDLGAEYHALERCVGSVLASEHPGTDIVQELQGETRALIVALEAEQVNHGRSTTHEYHLLWNGLGTMLERLNAYLPDPPIPQTGSLDNFRDAHSNLANRVRLAVVSQSNNSALLDRIKDEVLRFISAAEPHREIFPSEEYNQLVLSVNNMLDCIAMTRLSDSSHLFHIPSVVWLEKGRTGRPRIQFDLEFISSALKTRGPTEVGRFLGCSGRTVRREAVRLGLLRAGQSPFTTVVHADGSRSCVRTGPVKRTQYTDIADDDLDRAVNDILLRCPNAGRRMITGYLESTSIREPRQRVQDSYLRVHGPPSGFLNRRVERREYSVSGVNAVWHHDGQHGLIRYKLVTHMFVDGYSRFIVGAGVHNNNRAATVLKLFLEATKHGVPRRLRGDHGVENVKVARWMDRHGGPGSYLWGMSVHNTRIERLWRDFTQAVGSKWKQFFCILEDQDGLNPDLPSHIWLIHWLFLGAINADLQQWVHAWNYHKLSLRGQPDRSPYDLFLFGVAEHGLQAFNRSIAPVSASEENASNPNNPFLLSAIPNNLSQVDCEIGDCGLGDAFEAQFLIMLQEDPDYNLDSEDMTCRRYLWQRALEIATFLGSSV